jgi:hypothetical protein
MEEECCIGSNLRLTQRAASHLPKLRGTAAVSIQTLSIVKIGKAIFMENMDLTRLYGNYSMQLLTATYRIYSVIDVFRQPLFFIE